MNKTLIYTAVAGSLGLGLASQAAHASDEQLLFPYVVKDTNRTTVVTLISDEGRPVSSGANVHLQYWTKSTTAANTAACEPNSTTLTFTVNDIVTFDTAGLLGPGPLFGDTTNLAPLGTSISYAAPRHGYLLADMELSSDNFSAGYWVEVDLANGGAHGDAALRSDDSANFTSARFNPFMALIPGDENDDNNPAFGVGRGAQAVPFWPASVASTVFTVTPLGSNMLTNENNQVVMHVRNSSDVQGAYDRNENGIDGTVPQTVRCVGRLTAAQLMPGVVANAAWAATGGWGWLANLGDGDTVYSEAASIDLAASVYQVDTSTAAGAGKFMQNATRIVSNNKVEDLTSPIIFF